MRTGVILLFVTLGLFAFLGLGRNGQPSGPQGEGHLATPRTQQDLPSRWELGRSLYTSRRIHIVYPGNRGEISAAYRELLAKAKSGRFRLEFYPDDQYPADSIGVAPLRLLGALNSNSIVQALLPSLPLRKSSNGFQFRGTNYGDSADIVHLYLPNPINPKMELRLTTGNSDSAILSFLRQSDARGRPVADYWIAQNDKLEVLGFYSDRGDQAWQFDSALEFHLPKDASAAVETEHFIIMPHGRIHLTHDLQVFGKREEANLQRVAHRMQWTESTIASLPKLRVHVWDDFEQKALFTRSADLRHLDRALGEVHLIWTPNAHGDDFCAEALWLVERLAPSKSAALKEGLVVALSEHWRGVGFLPWAARLVATNNAPSLRELFDTNIGPMESSLVRQPLLGSFVSLILEELDPSEFAQMLRRWPENGVPDRLSSKLTLAEVENRWRRMILKKDPAPLRHQRPNTISPQELHRGFCYAHEGYQVYNGYMGTESRRSLEKLASMNVNAISVTPFGYLRDPHQPDFLHRSDGVGSENDESLLAVLTAGRKLGMQVMMKPHVLMSGPNWGWPGEIAMNSRSDWDLFFDRYERWMRHYAILAEMYGFDSLCMGVELVNATREHEDVWRAMIRRMRGLYSGPIIYAANWGEEFERLAFWDELDAIAVNCYYPLSTSEAAPPGELLQGAEEIGRKLAEVAAKYRKPVLITEVGFPSRSKAWLQPHDDNRDAAVDVEAQRRCYEALLQALWGKPWLAGIYWWKWPTYLEDGGMDDNQFTPNGKPAAQVVAKWYGGSIVSEKHSRPLGQRSTGQ